MPIDFVHHLADESQRFLAAIDRTAPNDPVPSCPDWSADDLIWHLAEVQHFWGAIVSGPMTDTDAYAEPDRPTDRAGLRNLFTSASERLVDALRGADDATPAWSWFEANQTIGFTRRRQAHEALIHRVDAELAANHRTDIDAVLATDGVLETIEWQFGGAPSWSTRAADAGPVGRVATTDTNAEWFVRIDRWSGTSPNTGTTYSDEPVLELVETAPTDPAFEIAGSAVELDLWMWNRGDEGVTIRGDATAFIEVVRVGVH